MATQKAPFTSLVVGKQGGTLFTNSIVAAGAINFVFVEDGTANTLHGTLLAAGGTTMVPVGFGLGFRVKIGNTLAAGATTFKLNGTSYNIKTQRSGGAGNLNTPIASGAILDFVVDSAAGTVQLMGY